MSRLGIVVDYSPYPAQHHPTETALVYDLMIYVSRESHSILHASAAFVRSHLRPPRWMKKCRRKQGEEWMIVVAHSIGCLNEFYNKL